MSVEYKEFENETDSKHLDLDGVLNKIKGNNISYILWLIFGALSGS